MSLTQKAKKKFFGSLSKRKKLKISENAGDKAPPLPRSRPPLPVFKSPSPYFEEPIGQLLSSKSLPDQLDQFGTAETSLASSTSLIDLDTPTVDAFRFTKHPSSSSRSSDYCTCVSNIPSTSYGSISVDITKVNDGPRNTECVVSSTNDILDFRLQQIAQSSDHVQSVKLQSNMNKETLPPDQSEHSERNPSLKSKPDKKKFHNKNETFNPRSPPTLTDSLSEYLDSDHFVNSLFSDIINDHNYSDCAKLHEDTNSESARNADDDVNLVDDSDDLDDVFESQLNDHPTCISSLPNSSPSFSITSPTTSPADDYSNANVLHNNTQIPNSKTNKIKYVNVIKIDSQQNLDLPKMPRMDNSVLKKVKFFESYQDTNVVNTPIIDNGSKSTVASPRNKRPFPKSEEETKNHLPTPTHDVAFSNCDSSSKTRLEAPRKVGRPPQPTSLRLFKNQPTSNGRLNFSRFRGSSTIHEIVARCGCGMGDQEECTACMETRSCVSGDNDSVEALRQGHRGQNMTNKEVCHHPQCTEDNGGLPLMLCRQCDLDIHKNPEYSGHLVLDCKIKRGQVRPPSPIVDNADESDSDSQHAANEDRVDGVFVKHNSQNRSKISTTELERKLKRKMALKKKGKNDLDVVLAQLADPEGYESSQFCRLDSESGEQRQGSDLGESSSILGQDSFDSPNEEVLTFDYGSLTSRVPVRRQSRVSVNNGSFTLKFCGSDGRKEDVEVVPAVQSTTLREAIEAALIRRNMDCNSVNVFIEKSHTPLPMSSESVFLAGNILEVKEKDDPDQDTSTQGKSRATSNKSTSGKGSKQSGGSLRGRTRSGNLSVDDTFYPPTSPGGSWSEAKRGKSPKLSVVNLFTPTNKDKERQDQLTEILNRYSIHGLPPTPELLALGRPKIDESIFEMEASWQSVVSNHQNMTKNQQEHQEAVWELLLTEVSYIKQIRVIIDVFQNCLNNIQLESFLNEIETERLFSNIDKVFECNCTFWQQYLLPVLQRGRECKQPLDPLLSKEGFVDHFASLFQVYFKYFIEHKSCQDYAKSCMENSDLFKLFIQWGETQKQCNRLKLADILVKPMQRLLKYSLLLQAIFKHTENEKDKTYIKEMIQSVDKLCWAANNSLRRREDYEKLEAVRRTIEPYDAIEAPNDECAKIIQEYNGNFNLLAPMPGFRDGPRSLLFQSSLRMKEAQNVKLDVDCLLFTDLILICKPNKRMERFKIIRPPMRLDQLVVSELKDKGSFLLIYMNEYHVPISAFTFHSDMGAIRGWLEKFREAQRDFKTKKIQESAELEQLRTDATTSQVEDGTSVPSYLDLVSSTLSRSESAESADRFIPNLLTPSDLSSDNVQLELTHSGSMLDVRNRPADSSTHCDLPHANTEPKLESSLGTHLSPSGKRRTDKNITEGNSSGGFTKHKPVQTSRSVPNIMVGNKNAGTPTDVSPPSRFGNTVENNFQETSENVGHKLFSLSPSGQPKDVHHSFSEGSRLEQNNISDEEDLAKQKLNSRRVSRTEKRYHTADSIQDMKNYDKDNSIHKRLSWRTDVQVMDNKNLGSRAISTDSVRSVPSSSGVSSTGSLHLTMETEISEEQEGNSNRSDNSCSPIMMDHLKLFSVGNSEDIDDDVDDDDCGTISDSKQSKSRSTSDLVTMFSNSLQVSQMEDGIASVAVSTDGFTRKLTHAEILKMKKLKHQILYDASIESSEV